MTSRKHHIIDLIDDPICVALMACDGVNARDVMTLMKSVRPLVILDRSYRRQQGRISRFAA